MEFPMSSSSSLVLLFLWSQILDIHIPRIHVFIPYHCLFVIYAAPLSNNKCNRISLLNVNSSESAWLLLYPMLRERMAYWLKWHPCDDVIWRHIIFTYFVSTNWKDCLSTYLHHWTLSMVQYSNIERWNTAWLISECFHFLYFQFPKQQPTTIYK